MQVGAEIIGNDGVAAAREIVRVALASLEAAGVTGITIDFTLPDLVDTLAASTLPLETDQIAAVKAELDAKDAGALTALGADAYLPLIAAAGPFEQAISRLKELDGSEAIASRIAALEAIAAEVGDKATVTLDPTERHGFEYQSWFGFSLFVRGASGFVGRGGSYQVAHGDGTFEPAIGFSLYPDPLIDDGLGRDNSKTKRIFLPVGHDEAAAAVLRAQGWVTIAALGENDDAVALGCSHRLGDNGPEAI